jgi:glucose/arabinose dehydrogenase
MAAVILAAVAAATPRPADSSVASLSTVRVASGLTRPLFVTHAPGDFGRIFIVEQGGLIKILDLSSGSVLATPFLDLSSVVGCCGDRGSNAIAFHPSYQTNGRFFVSYTNVAGDSELARYTVLGAPATSNVGDPSSASILFTVSEAQQSHNIGWIAFGPDGYLYVAKGDGGFGCDPFQQAQDLDLFHGKLLRLDVDSGSPYGIPPDNPFVGIPGADEIWVYGLRNPWRNAFDELTGDLFIADVGQLEREEINFQSAASAGGENYGWDCMEGSACSTISGCGMAGCVCGAPDLLGPIYEYDHTVGCSITGGEVYRGCAIEDLGGSYFFADYCSNQIWTMRYDGTNVVGLEERTAELAPGGGLAISSIVSFGRDAFGEIYVLDLLGGEVFKLVPATAGATRDCNGNSVEDACDLRSGTSLDADTDGIPDECDPAASFDHFMFYKTKPHSGSAKFRRFGPVRFDDSLGGADYIVVKPKSLGLAADKNMEGIFDPATQLIEYKVKPTAGSTFLTVPDVIVANQCGEVVVELGKPISILVPTAHSLTSTPAAPVEGAHNVDHFLCYKTKLQRQRSDGTPLPDFPSGIQVRTTDPFEPVSRRHDLRRISKVCVPAAKSGNPLISSGPSAGTPKTITPSTVRNPDTHLLCYKDRLARRLIPQDGCGPIDPNDKQALVPASPSHTRISGVHTNNQFGPGELDTIREVELCVPSLVFFTDGICTAP